MRSAGNGSSVSNVAAANAVTGPISTKCDSRTAPPARRRVTLPGGVRVPPVGGLGELQAGVLGAGHEAVEEPARQDDVVVEDDQPVEARARMLGEQRVEVLELARVAHRDRVHRDLVARAVQLDAGGAHEPAGPLDAEHEDAPPRVRPRRAVAAAARARAASRSSSASAARASGRRSPRTVPLSPDR